MALRAKGAAMPLAGLAAGVAALLLTLGRDHAEIRVVGRPAEPVLVLLIGWGFLGAALVARRRVENRAFARLLAAVAFAWFAATLTAANTGFAFTVGLVLAPLWIAVLLHALLAFPRGHLESRLARAAVAAFYLEATLFSLAYVLTAKLGDADCAGCPDNILYTGNDQLAQPILIAQQDVLGVAALLAGVVVCVIRWRSASVALRRALAPVLISGGLSFALIALIVFAEPLWSGRAAEILQWAGAVVIAAVPAAFIGGLLRARLARLAIGGLVVELGTESGVRDLEAVLAKALGDPSVELAYRLENGDHVNQSGAPIAVSLSNGRGATPVVRNGVEIAVILHDASLSDDSTLLDTASAALGLSLENGRLDAALRARIEELRASRARIVSAGDEERRRIERDLHDGAQQRLVALALNLRLARDYDNLPAMRGLVDEAIAELTEATAELRELARGIHPAVLTDRGLDAALNALAGRARIPVEVRAAPEERFAPPIESTVYFVVAEALTNVARYSQASHAEVEIGRENGTLVVEVRDDGVGGAAPGRGSGLRGLADRVAAVDGRLAVMSEPGEGTTIRAEIPCAP